MVHEACFCRYVNAKILYKTIEITIPGIIGSIEAKKSCTGTGITGIIGMIIHTNDTQDEAHIIVMSPRGERCCLSR